MCTHRVAEIVKSRSDFSDEEIGRMSEHDAWQLIHADASALDRTEDERCQNDPGDRH